MVIKLRKEKLGRYTYKNRFVYVDNLICVERIKREEGRKVWFKFRTVVMVGLPMKSTIKSKKFGIPLNAHPDILPSGRFFPLHPFDLTY